MHNLPPRPSTSFFAFLFLLGLLVSPIRAYATCVADPANPQRSIVTLSTPSGEICLQLYDDLTPDTVTNFLDYVTSGDWDGMFFHSSVNSINLRAPASAIQAGTFVHEGGAFNFARTSPASIDGEWDHAANSNLRGTVTMALSAGPDSGTSQWFINVSNNDGSAGPSLDDASTGGPFTVFGNVVNDDVGYDTMNVVDTIYALDTVPPINLQLLLGTIFWRDLKDLPLTSQPVETPGSYGCYNSFLTMIGIDAGDATDPSDPDYPSITYMGPDPWGSANDNLWLSQDCATAGPDTDLTFYPGGIPSDSCEEGDQYLAADLELWRSPGGAWVYSNREPRVYASFDCEAVEASRDGLALWKADVESQVVSALITTSPSLTYLPEPNSTLLQACAFLALAVMRGTKKPRPSEDDLG